MKTVPKPRLFDKRIQFITAGPVPDGFGGSITQELPGVYVWSYIRKVSDVAQNDFVSQYGLTKNAYIIRATIRERAFEARNTGFLYNGDLFRVLVALPNDQYDVSIDLIAYKIEPPTPQ